MIKESNYEKINKINVEEIFEGAEKQLTDLWNKLVDILYDTVKRNDDFSSSKEDYLKYYFTEECFHQEIIEKMAILLTKYFRAKRKGNSENKYLGKYGIKFPFEFECRRISKSEAEDIIKDYDIDNADYIDAKEDENKVKEILSNLRNFTKLGMTSADTYPIYCEYFKYEKELYIFKCVSTNTDYYVREINILKEKGD